MGPVFYVMAILGCGDNETTCEPVRIEQTQYASAVACEAATAAALGRNADIDYPVVMAKCRPNGTMLTQASPNPRS